MVGMVGLAVFTLQQKTPIMTLCFNVFPSGRNADVFGEGKGRKMTPNSLLFLFVCFFIWGLTRVARADVHSRKEHLYTGRLCEKIFKYTPSVCHLLASTHVHHFPWCELAFIAMLDIFPTRILRYYRIHGYAVES